MEFFIKATYIGKDGEYGYTNGEEYEFEVYLSEGTIKVYETPSGGEWEFSDLYSFLQSWSYISME